MIAQERTHYWQQQFDHWQHSGLSGKAFCKQRELSYHQFTYWRRKLEQVDPDQPTASLASGFVRVTALPTPSSGELVLSLPSGVSITGLNAGNVELLGAILRLL